MQEVKCLVDGKYQKEIAYNLNDFPFDKLKAKTRGKQKFIELPATFDIETTNVFDHSGNKNHFAFAYHFQMCVEGYVWFGRYWHEYIGFMDRLIDTYKLDKSHRLVIYVHNLSFEFQFMYNFIKFKNIFATDERAVLTCRNDTFEFRCSYKLSNMSLEKFIENTPNTHHQKGIDDLDYSIKRTPDTPLTKIELGYCYNDVLGLYECLIEMLKEDTLKSIPLTSTGYVRRDCRNAMRKNKKNRKNFLKTKINVQLYELFKLAFRGGNTASNRYLTNQIIDLVHSYDISSSYPFVMIACDFPMGKFMRYEIETWDELERLNHKYCTVGTYILKDLKLKKGVPIPYIPLAKCQSIEFEKDERGKNKNCVYNGRILSAKWLKISLTNIDFEIIKNQYDFDENEFYVSEMWFARKGKLPNELRKMIIHYFELKTTLKGVEGKEYEYMKSKNKLNAIYGMCVTDILHMIYEFTDCEWKKQESIDKEKEIEKYYNNRNNFLSYQWGLFVTAYARQRLQQAIDLVGLDCVYCDTDSVKYIGDYDIEFEKLNSEITNGDFDIKPYIDYNNHRVFLGTWEKEDDYYQFITMGAKKYAYYYMNGKIGITVAGLNKSKGAAELWEKGGLEWFRLDEIFHDSGRTSAYYNDNVNIDRITYNGCTFETSSNVALIETTYTLGITGSMLEILDLAKQEKELKQWKT